MDINRYREAKDGILLIVAAALLTLMSSPAGAYTFEQAMTESIATTTADNLRNSAHFDLSDTYIFPAEPRLLEFFFERLAVTGALARASRTIDLTVQRRGYSSYSVKAGRRLEGSCMSLGVNGSGARFVGRGGYHQDYLPFSLRGSALLDLRWSRRENQPGVILSVRLRLSPASDVLGVIGTVFDPLIRLVLNRELNRIVSVGKDFSEAVRSRPYRLLKDVKERDADYGRVWKEFLEIHGKEVFEGMDN